MASDQPRIQALVVSDEAGTYYEVPWEIVVSHRVSGPRTRALQDLFEGDTTGFMGSGPTPTARTIVQSSGSGKSGQGQPGQQFHPRIPIIAILIG